MPEEAWRSRPGRDIAIAGPRSSFAKNLGKVHIIMVMDPITAATVPLVLENEKNGIMEHKFAWTRGKLDKGFTSYAEHLGEDPEKVIFMNSCVVNPEGKSWSMAQGLDEKIVTLLSGPGSTALHFPLTKSEEAYTKAYLAEGTLHPVQKNGEGFVYPDFSAVTALLQQLEIDPNAHEILREKVIVNSYTTEEVESLAEAMGGSTLMDCDTFLKFGGKDYLHVMARDEGFKVPPGFVIESAPESAKALVEMCRGKLMELGINPDNTKIWIKVSSLGGGRGIIDKPDAKPQSLLEAFNFIAQEYQEFGFFGGDTTDLRSYHPVAMGDLADARNPFEGIVSFMPIVVEVDVGQLPNVKKKLDDVAVNAIVGKKGVVHIDSLPFAAPDGRYMGSRLPQVEDDYIVLPSEIEADKLLQRMWREGYRGYVGVDAMVVEEFDGSIKAYLNDINPRLCGATPLIAMAHKVEAKLGRRPVGFTLKSHNIPLPEKCEDVFQAALDLMGHHLYRGIESGYTGIVPVQVDVRPPHYDCFYLRSVAIARDNQHLRELQNVMDPSWSVDQSMSLASIEVIPGVGLTGVPLGVKIEVI